MVGERTLYRTRSKTVPFASRPPGMQFGCVFIIFGSDTYRKSFPNTEFRICRRSRTSEHKVGFSRCAVQFHYILLHMSRSIKIGLFELLNSVWLIHCLKSQIAMTKLTGRYVVLIVSFQKNCQKFLNRTPLVFQIRTGVRFTHQVVRFMVRWIKSPIYCF